MKPVKGFTLIELAMVLFILSLLLGGLLVPLATQLEARKRSEAQEQLERIREALIGFAIINGRLPCHTVNVNPASANYGIEDSPCDPSALAADGILPWKTLGLDNGLDPWGVQRTATSDPWTGHWRYRVDRNFTENPCPPETGLFTLSRGFCDDLNILDADGNQLNAATERPLVIIYSTGPNQTADGQNASYEPLPANNPTYQGGTLTSNFDDITIWLTRPLLFNRMVSAGVLP